MNNLQGLISHITQPTNQNENYCLKNSPRRSLYVKSLRYLMPTHLFFWNDPFLGTCLRQTRFCIENKSQRFYQSERPKIGFFLLSLQRTDVEIQREDTNGTNQIKDDKKLAISESLLFHFAFIFIIATYSIFFFFLSRFLHLFSCEI